MSEMPAESQQPALQKTLDALGDSGRAPPSLSPDSHQTERLQLLADLNLHPDDDDPVFESVTAMAASLCGVSTAVVALIDPDSQCFRAWPGGRSSREPLDTGFGNWVIAHPEAGILEIPDARLDPRFASNPRVTEERGIRFFAGAPIRPLGDHAIGAFCLVAYEPHRLSDDDRRHLLQLTAIAEQLLRLRLTAERERQSVEQARSSEERYRYLTDNVADTITVHRPDRSVRYVSPNVSALLGYSVEEMTNFGRDRSFAHPDDGDTLLVRTQALTPENPTTHMEVRLVHKNGEAIHTSVHTRAIFIDGKVHELHSAIRDNREVHKYRTSLEQTNRELTELAVERNTLIQAVAHDLSAPLAAIRLTAESIATRVEPAIAAQTNQLRDLAGAAEAMISDLLRVTEPGSAVIKLTTETTDIAAVVHHSLMQVAASNPLSLDVDSFDGVVDPKALSRVLINVISNAVRHTPARTPIGINAHRVGGLAVITVSDEGPGIAEHDRDRLLQPYQRGSNASVPGSGLGLAIARALTESHGGELLIGQNEPHGLVVTITLPVAVEPAEE